MVLAPPGERMTELETTLREGKNPFKAISGTPSDEWFYDEPDTLNFEVIAQQRDRMMAGFSQHDRNGDKFLDTKELDLASNSPQETAEDKKLWALVRRSQFRIEALSKDSWGFAWEGLGVKGNGVTAQDLAILFDQFDNARNRLARLHGFDTLLNERFSDIDADKSNSIRQDELQRALADPLMPDAAKDLIKELAESKLIYGPNSLFGTGATAVALRTRLSWAYLPHLESPRQMAKEFPRRPKK
jgi:hypothetical protein